MANSAATWGRYNRAKQRLDELEDELLNTILEYAEQCDRRRVEVIDEYEKKVYEMESAIRACTRMLSKFESLTDKKQREEKTQERKSRIENIIKSRMSVKALSQTRRQLNEPEPSYVQPPEDPQDDEDDQSFNSSVFAPRNDTYAKTPNHAQDYSQPAISYRPAPAPAPAPQLPARSNTLKTQGEYGHYAQPPPSKAQEYESPASTYRSAQNYHNDHQNYGSQDYQSQDPSDRRVAQPSPGKGRMYGKDQMEMQEVVSQKPGEPYVHTPHEEPHKGGAASQYIKSIIYGGLDGIVSVFVTVAAVSGSNLGIGFVLILGLAKLIAGGISMGVGDWLATDAEIDMAKTEKKREQWELENYMEGEVQEMIELYVSKGVPEDAAAQIVGILAKHRDAFVDIMMAEELGISPDIVDEKAWKHGAINFGSFMGFGVVPLLVYIIIVGAAPGTAAATTFGISIALTGVTLIAMGFMKAYLTGSSMWKSALMTVGLGGFSAFLGWLIGFILDHTTGVRIEA